jgi:alpha-L-fucosidase 2
MLLQSYSGTIRLFPAVPAGWQDVAFRRLRAEGAFVISAERQAGRTTRVEILAEVGGPCCLENPFAGASYEVQGLEAEAVRRDGADLVFETSPGQTMRFVRRDAR